MNEISTKGNARNEAMAIMDEYTKENLQVGEYAYKLVTETYINLIGQAQSGQILCVDGQILDIKVGITHPLPNTNKFINGYRMGNYAVNYQQKTNAFACDYDENERIIITNGFLIEEQLNNQKNSIGNVIYDGTFKNITQEGLSILELCMKFSALNFDMAIDNKLLKTFSETIKQSNLSVNELPLLSERKTKL